MKVKHFEKTGKKKTAQFEIEDSVFATDVNEKLLAQAVHVYLSNQRQSNAHTKDRGDVRGGGKKPWNQKGTGRARQGSIRSPQWKGGGVVFGPTNERNYKKSLSKNMVKAAIRSAFSLKASKDGVIVFEGMEITDGKRAKSLISILDKANIGGKVLIITNTKQDLLISAANNLRGVKVEVVNSLNPYKILNYETIVLLEDALPTVYEYWK